MFKPVKCPEDCYYLQTANGGSVQVCGYLFITHEMRGCDPGFGCKRYVGKNEDLKNARHRKTTWDVVKGKEMWKAGYKDSQISKALKVKPDTVRAYRRRVWEKEKTNECV